MLLVLSLRIKFAGKDVASAKCFYVLLFAHVFIFVSFHGCRLYGSLYQLFHETERYHSGNLTEEGLYLGGLNPACIDIDEFGRLIKTAYSKECVREVDYAIWTFFGLAWVFSIPIFALSWLFLANSDTGFLNVLYCYSFNVVNLCC